MKIIKTISALLIALWLAPITMVTAGPLDGASGLPLHPDKAFSLSTRSIDDKTLETSWKIADGYYMYRKFFKFEVLDKNIELGSPVIPKGIIKLDKTFNERLEIFKHNVVIQLPFKRINATATQTKIRITSQGCNEPIGLCYTPVTKDITFKLLPAAAATTGARTDTPKSLKDLQKNVSSASKKPDYLPAGQAFKIEVKPSGKNKVRVWFDFEKKYYLYKKEIQFRLLTDKADNGDIRLGKYSLPRGKKRTDKYVGKTEVYTRKFSVTLPILGQQDQPYVRKLTVRYQGCKEDAICYPPNTRIFNVSADAKGKLEITDITPTKPAASDTTAKRQTSESVNAWNFIKTVLIALIVGLALTFTPCVLPMIPILSSIIIGQSKDGKDKSNLHGGALSISYVLGTSVIWTIAGVFAGATGKQFHAYFQNIWFLGGASVLFILLALSMFGFYNIQMPGFIQSHLHRKSHKMQGGTLFGVFILGIFSSMVVGACVSPLLIFALGAALQTGDPVLGGVTMFALSLGMGTILILIGFGANWLLPRAGVWMDAVKHFFGVLLIAVAIYLMGQIPEYDIPVLYLWAPLFIIYSIYLGAFQSLPVKSSGWRFFSKGLGMLLFVWGVLALIGAFGGNRDILRPIDLSKLGGSSAVQVKSMAELFIKVRDVQGLNQHIEEARQAGKPVLVDYYASWCTDCIRMERTTFRDPAVQDMMAKFVNIKIDISKPSKVTDALKSRLNVYGPPATILFDSKGKERKDLNFYGYRSAKDFIAILEKV
ncbi:MAG: protein-disulfide reductase DsbD [Gammaproteobacteria bacterium]|nr:MAG: protein-disulfide reductase DsbD [Gammaproteobacteria bacterium]